MQSLSFGQKFQLVENLSTKLEESTGVYHLLNLLYGFSVIVACGFICQVSRPLCFTSVRGACGLNESALLYWVNGNRSDLSR